ncbi:formate--tetrahydrofolate ligase [Fructilactobacillus myrtifloralis]|uniref:Formate--tetrahydrofolate ligase n=1 Tax=Fructilactobacillus myrtifloralis TaxID=2940301 RepID=A0ABY5BQY4_9LACO|nr:formate--tetrahydrofolate ligase [Fructilactobacillus myrtifloralis]USS85660.1 formate--tetrahydrofolate ligase [Fructilactobacillus myrtifloralis]
MQSDIEIAQAAHPWPITKVAEAAGFQPEEVLPYGRQKAKIERTTPVQPDHFGKLVLVTSINPTPAGEGKSTVAVGLADAMQQAGHRTMLALREPSLGPVMGLKGGATGGGYSQVIPMEDINLHFTGDFHALTVAQNTLVALVDNSIYQGNPFHLDPRQVVIKRVLDVNDRSLRHLVTGLGGRTSGVPQEGSFEITAASEMMAILTLATDLSDLKRRINRIVVGYTYDQTPVTVAELGVGGAIATLLKDAILPNLVQTIAHTPALIHGGPFANIAQGTNSIQATQLALQQADYTVTEAGFGADLGGEKFLDVKTPLLGKHPDAIVVVATVRALKMHGGLAKDQLDHEDLAALQRGLANLGRHVHSMKRYGVPVVVAVNRFTNDTDAELQLVVDYARQLEVPAYPADVWGHGGAGAQALAAGVVAATEQPAAFTPLYAPDADLLTKLKRIVTEIYGGQGVELAPKAVKQLHQLTDRGWDRLPVIVAKTQYSVTDDAKRLGAPTDFKIHIREFVPKLGAGFIVAMAGNILTMPGLPKHPAAEQIKITDDGTIQGLF